MDKKRWTLGLAMLLLLAAASFGAEKKVLILYFSMPERDAVDARAGSSRLVEKGAVVGNVEWVARSIQRTVGGDLVALRPDQAYPASHAPLVEQASAEKKAQARPKLRGIGIDIADYDLIFLGYPIWWADLPMPLYTFLETQDFKGKTIVPFSVHGGSGFAGTIDTITRLEPKAVVVQKGFTVSRDSVGQSAAAIKSWLNGLKLMDAR